MIGTQIKKYRQMLKMTGETLANLAGIQRSYLSQIENEKKYPPMDTFMNLVKAIARNAPIKSGNYEDILTEKAFEDFVNLLEIDIHYVDNEYFEGKYVIYIHYQSMELYHSVTDEKPDKNKIINNNISKQFFEGWREDRIYNLLTITGHEDEFSIAYSIEDIRESLYIWWYEFLLTEFLYFAESKNSEFSENEADLISQIKSLRNEDGSFSPIDNDTTNLSNELLNGKIVTFDMRSINDKNMRVLLDGDLLSNDELTAIKFTLNGIRYTRQKK